MRQKSPQQRADAETITRIARGDHSAFATLFDRLGSPLYSLAYGCSVTQAKRRDAVQDVFLQIWRHASSYDDAQSSVFTWAVLLTRSRVIDRLRTRVRRVRLEEVARQEQYAPGGDVTSTSASGADITNRNEDAARVRSALAELPAQQRKAVELAFFTALTHQRLLSNFANLWGR
jgi:RNA polymerase sigma-70 factor, ECF subfamily